MFQKGDYVVYNSKGIFQVQDTTTLSMDGISKDRLYYVMQDIAKKDLSVYAPVDSDKSTIRAIMSREEADSFLKSIADIEIIDIKNVKQRDEQFKICIRSCEPTELMRVIKSLHIKKEERKQSGKRLTVSDSHFLEQAEHILLEELKLALVLDKEALRARIFQELGISEV